jgi:hypothetical protein
MWHATCTQLNQGNYRLLVVRSQIGSLTPNPSFGHNLCFEYPNGSCKPISYIYISRAFQWYKELFNPMNCDPCNCPLKIWSPTPKVGGRLGVWGFIPSNFLTLLGAWNVTLGLHSWHAPLQALDSIVSPRLRLWHLTIFHLLIYIFVFHLMFLAYAIFHKIIFGNVIDKAFHSSQEKIVDRHHWSFM